MKMNLLKIVLSTLFIVELCSASIPLAINTWKFGDAAKKAWQVLNDKPNNALEALIEGCKVCQDKQCEFTVGYGGSPDENGESTLDALIFDGATMDMGAVGGLRNVKNAIKAASYVLKNTEHSFLVGSLATDFAHQMGLPEESLSTNYSLNLWEDWKKQMCQPNFWKDVNPDPKTSCGPYRPTSDAQNAIKKQNTFDSRNHDTIGMIIIDESGHILAGTSTNGANHKIPGRVGDSPIPGAGAYADNEVGAAVGTGDGDIMMRFLPSFLAVEQMRQGASPEKAAKIAIDRIAAKYPDFFGAVLAVNYKGDVGAACHGMENFPYSIANAEINGTSIKYIKCVEKTVTNEL